MVAFNGFLFGFGAGDYGIATGEEEDAGRGIVESTSGTRENFGIV